MNATNEEKFTIQINGNQCVACAGETVVEVANRAGVNIPTLCHDPRLEPVGACRVCLVEVEGQRRMQPGCAWKVHPGMVVTTESEKIQRHRTVLYSLYAADHEVDADGAPIETANANELRQLCETVTTIPLEPVEAPLSLIHI